MTAITAPAAPIAINADRAWRVGLPTGVGLLVVAVTGMGLAFNSRLIITGILSMGWIAFAMLPFVAGWIAAGRVELEGVVTAPPGPADIVTGALTGLWAGVPFATFVVLLATVGDDVRRVLIQVSPQLLAMLTFGKGTGFGVAVALAMPALAAAIGATIRIMPERVRKAGVAAITWVVFVAVLENGLTGALRSLKLRSLEDFLYTNNGMTVVGAVVVAAVAFGARYGLHGQRAARAAARPVGPPSTAAQLRMYGLLLAAAVVLPLIFDRSVNDLMINVVIFGIMALGLNIVIGLAGMLDLGYVAFFAVGAYVSAALTAVPTLSFWIGLNERIASIWFVGEYMVLPWPFWIALPVAVATAVATGIFVGTPVIGLRGDYLAIVTLGFAAIAQVLVVSDWLSPVLGGPQGVRNVPPVPLGIVDPVNATIAPTGFLWLSLGFLGVAIYAAWRLQNSRLGRAWLAIREDETVAEAMGINTAVLKLTAFSVGAVFASLAGVLFAAKVSSVFPTSFELLVSVVVLVVVIVGGTGYVPGVLLGSLVLVGVLGGPTTQGLLAEFAQYKMLIYGALLVAMMLVRPQGLLPKPDKGREIAQEEMDQDAWFDKNVGGSSAAAAAKNTEDEA